MSADPPRPAPRAVVLYSLLGVMILVWSVSFLLGKMALREIPGLLFSGIRTTLAAVLVVPICIWASRGRKAAWTRREAPWLFLLGTAGVALNQMFFVLGLARTTVSHAALMIAVTPALVLLIAAARGQERLSARKLAGLGLSVAGVALLQSSAVSAKGATAAGDAFVLLAAVSVAFYTVFGKEAATRHGALTMNAFAYVGGAVVLAPVTLSEGAVFNFGSVTAAGWGGLLYMVVFSSIVGHTIYAWALTHLPASRVSTLSLFQPVVATALAVIFLGESVTTAVVSGGAMVLAGVWLAEHT